MLVNPTGQWLQARGSHGLAAEATAALTGGTCAAPRPRRPGLGHGGRRTPSAARSRSPSWTSCASTNTRRRSGGRSPRASGRCSPCPWRRTRLRTACWWPTGRSRGSSVPPRSSWSSCSPSTPPWRWKTAELRAAQERTIAELSAKREVLEWAEAQHRRLMQLLLNEAGLQRLAELLAEALHVLHHDRGRRRHRARCRPAERPEGTATPAPDPATRKRRSVAWPWSRCARATRRRRSSNAAPTVGPAWVTAVVIGGQLVGRLPGTGVSAVPDPAQRRMIERFALVVAVELLQQLDRANAANRLAGDLLRRAVAHGGEPVPGTLPERAAALGHDLGGPQVLAVVAIDKSGAGDAGKLADTVRAATHRPGAAAGRRPRRPAGADPARRVGPHTDPGPRPRAGGCAGGRPGGGEWASAFGRRSRLRRCVLHRRRGRRALSGRGPRRRARPAQARARRLPPARTRTTAALRSFADTLVRPLEEHDARRKSQLCETVRTWLAVGASVPAAAKELIVHPETAAYRLTRAEQLLQRDLRATATRMELQLAFTVRDIQRARGALKGSARENSTDLWPFSPWKWRFLVPRFHWVRSQRSGRSGGSAVSQQASDNALPVAVVTGRTGESAAPSPSVTPERATRSRPPRGTRRPSARPSPRSRARAAPPSPSPRRRRRGPRACWSASAPAHTVVANAGIARPSDPLHQIDLAAWRECMATDLDGVFLTFRAFIPSLIAAGAGSLIAISSMTGKRPLYGRTPYAASKMGVIGLVAHPGAGAGSARHPRQLRRPRRGRRPPPRHRAAQPGRRPRHLRGRSEGRVHQRVPAGPGRRGPGQDRRRLHVPCRLSTPRRPSPARTSTSTPVSPMQLSPSEEKDSSVTTTAPTIETVRALAAKYNNWGKWGPDDSWGRSTGHARS